MSHPRSLTAALATLTLGLVAFVPVGPGGLADAPASTAGGDVDASVSSGVEGAPSTATSSGVCAVRITDPDGAEPPCNPFLASRAWSTNHRTPYAQGSSPLPGPTAADAIVPGRVDLQNATPVIIQISEPYPDGRRTLWFTSTDEPETRGVWKLDYDTLEVIDHYTSAEAEGEVPALVATTSGVYNLLAAGNRLVSVRPTGFWVFGDVAPGERTSPIELQHVFELPSTAFCRATDRIIGINLTYDGNLAFATVQGMVGTVPIDAARMDERHLRVVSLNGDACGDPLVDDEDLEQVSNSLAADEGGGIYVVTTQRMLRLARGEDGMSVVWSAPYETGGGAAGATLAAGSGSTPSLMGTDGDDDRFVVITDGQELMHLVLFWRDEIPADWEGLPGRDRRIACEFPITFGDPAATRSVSEQSVLVRGYGSMVVNNALSLDRLFAGLPPGVRPLSALTGSVPGNAPSGAERVDWDPVTRTCASTWANAEVSIPNGVPTMSAASGLVYGTGVKDGTWGLVGLDWASGAEKLWVPRSPSPFENSFFAATTIGAERDVLQGTVGGITVYRTDRSWARLRAGGRRTGALPLTTSLSPEGP